MECFTESLIETCFMDVFDEMFTDNSKYSFMFLPLITYFVIMFSFIYLYVNIIKKEEEEELRCIIKRYDLEMGLIPE
jgi:hypothetical protein